MCQMMQLVAIGIRMIMIAVDQVPLTSSSLARPGLRRRNCTNCQVPDPTSKTAKAVGRC